MNGRCITDPFDQAVNVCGLCFGEYCQTCLVDVKGRRHPLCTECAIIASGVRAGAKPVTRGSRKTAKARRTALAEAPTQTGFEFFDEGSASPETPTPSAGGGSKEAAPSKPKKRTKRATTKAAAKTAGKSKTKKTTKKKSASRSKRLAGDEPAEQPSPTAVGTGEVTASKPSAIDQLDTIRGRENGPGEQSAASEPSAESELVSNTDGDNASAGTERVQSFRKPRPFIQSAESTDTTKPRAKPAATKARPTPAKAQPAAAKVQPPVAPRQTAAAKAQSPSPSNEAPAQKPLAKRRSKSKQAQPTAAAPTSTTAAESTSTRPEPAAGSPKQLAKRRSTIKPETATAADAPTTETKPEPAAKENLKPMLRFSQPGAKTSADEQPATRPLRELPSGRETKAASKPTPEPPPAAEPKPETTGALPKRRRKSDPKKATPAEVADTATEGVESTAPPAWTQRPHHPRRSQGEDPQSAEASDSTPAESEMAAASSAPNGLPKRRRTSK